MTVFTKPNKSQGLAVGVAGGSGSGKTFFVRALQDRLGPENCVILYQDSFYFDQSKKFDRDGGAVNFDHPDSLDFVSLAEAIHGLKSRCEVAIPVYDFVTHCRLERREVMRPAPIILVDGTLILHAASVRAELDARIYFDTPETLRFQRRLKRDVEERGRTEDGVREQFLKQVKPMHDLFVEPSKRHAQLCVSDLGEFDKTLNDYVSLLSSYCQR